MTTITPLTLRGKYVTLEPLDERHHDGLFEAACDGELWNLWYTAVPRPEEMGAEIQRRLGLQDDGSMGPFTTRLNDLATGEPGKIIGMTTYSDIDADPATFGDRLHLERGQRAGNRN